MASVSIKSVLLLDGIDKICAEILSSSGISVTVKGKLSLAELLREVKLHDAMVVRSATKVTSEVLEEGAPRLKLVGRAGTGTDNIDVEAATNQGVIVMNTPGGNTVSAAEHTCALICSLGRFLPQACATLKAGAWERKMFLGNEIFGKTLAIIGLGRIGREVAHRMQSFGMTTIGYDPFVDAATAAEWNIESLQLEQIWPRADYITVHTPLLPHTKNLVGEEVLFKKCKRGVKVINVARGGIIDEAALLKALNDGACGGAALDVFVNEPPKDFTLCKHPNVVCTPHLGANTVEAQKRVAQEIADQMVTASEGGPLTGLINAHAMAAGAVAKPWLKLAVALGQLAAALVKEVKGSKIDVKCYGSEIASFSKSLGTGTLAGLLQDSTNGSANLINAPKLAKDYSITLQDCSLTTERDALLPLGVPESLTVSATAGAVTAKVTGSVSNGLAVLFSINECVWSTGVPLNNSIILCRPNSGEPSSVPTNILAASKDFYGLWVSSPDPKKKIYSISSVGEFNRKLLKPSDSEIVVAYLKL